MKSMTHMCLTEKQKPPDVYLLNKTQRLAPAGKQKHHVRVRPLVCRLKIKKGDRHVMTDDLLQNTQFHLSSLKSTLKIAVHKEAREKRNTINQRMKYVTVRNYYI